MNKQENGKNQINSSSEKAKIRCIIEITQPDGNVIRVASEAIDALPALETTSLESRKDLMDFINSTEKGILEVRNEAGRKSIETYTQELLKKTNQDQVPSDKSKLK